MIFFCNYCVLKYFDNLIERWNQNLLHLSDIHVDGQNDEQTTDIFHKQYLGLNWLDNQVVMDYVLYLYISNREDFGNVEYIEEKTIIQNYIKKTAIGSLWAFNEQLETHHLETALD